VQTPAAENSFLQALDKFLIATFVVSKLVVASLLLAAFILIPSNANLWNRFYTGNVRTLYIPFCNWDGQHFLLLAERGYADPSVQYFVGCHPLFPLSIALTNSMLLNTYLAGLVNVTIFSFMFLWLFYAYARRFLSIDRTRLAVVLMLLYPSSLFLSVIYSESLFLLCFVAFLWLYGCKHWGAVVFAALLPLSRANGLLVAAAIVAYLGGQLWRRTRPDLGYELKVLGGFSVGTVLCGLFYKLTTGSYWAGLEAQKYFVAEASALHIVDVPRFIRYLLSHSVSWFAYNNGRVDKVLVLFMLAGIPVVMRSKVLLHVFLYAVLAIVPATMGVGAMSYARYSLLAVPFLIIALLQLCTSRKTCLILFACLGTVFLVVQILFVVRFALNLWVG
jgi:hypothetical protein